MAEGEVIVSGQWDVHKKGQGNKNKLDYFLTLTHLSYQFAVSL